MLTFRKLSPLTLAIDIITGTFLILFLWEYTQNINTVLIFGIGYFAAIPAGALVSGIISDRLSPKISYLAGSILQIGQLILLFQLQMGPMQVAILGLLGGLGHGLKLIPASLFDFIESAGNITEEKDTSKKYARKTLLLEIIEIILPVTAAYFIYTTGSFSGLFYSAAGFITLAAILVLFVKTEYISNVFSLQETLTLPGGNTDRTAMLKAVFIEGIAEGLVLTVLPVIVLIQIGGILQWGILHSVLVFFSLIIGLFLGRLINDETYRVYYAMAAIIFAIVSIFFISGINLIIILLFLVAKSFIDVIKNIGYYASIERIISKERKEYKFYSEYQFLISLMTGIGRIIPLAVLIFFGLNFEENRLLGNLTFLIIGILPLLTLSVLGHTAVFLKGYNEPKRHIRPEERPETLSG